MNYKHTLLESSLSAGTRGISLDALVNLLTEDGDPSPLVTVDQALDDGTLVPHQITGNLIHCRFVDWGGCKDGTCHR